MDERLVSFLAEGGNIGAILVALSIAGARPLGFVLLCPVFSRFGVQEGIVRGGVLVAFSLPALPLVLGEFATAGQPGPQGYTFLMAKEIFVGAVLGLLSGLPFWAASAAGDMIDSTRGAAMSTLVDPGSGSETTVTGTFFFLVCVLWLIAGGVFVPAIFGPLFDTYAIYPIFQMLPALEPARGAALLDVLDTLFRAGLVLALPLILPFLILDLLIAVAGKYLHQLNPMTLSMAAKQIVFVFVLLIYTTSFATYALGGFGRDTGDADLLQIFFGAPDER